MTSSLRSPRRRDLQERIENTAFAMTKAAGGMLTAEGEYPELRQLQLSTLFDATAKLLRDILLLLGDEGAREQELQEQGSRVDGERRAAGPTGSTASGNVAVRTTWICDTCHLTFEAPARYRGVRCPKCGGNRFLHREGSNAYELREPPFAAVERVVRAVCKQYKNQFYSDGDRAQIEDEILRHLEHVWPRA